MNGLLLFTHMNSKMICKTIHKQVCKMDDTDKKTKLATLWIRVPLLLLFLIIWSSIFPLIGRIISIFARFIAQSSHSVDKEVVAEINGIFTGVFYIPFLFLFFWCLKKICTLKRKEKIPDGTPETR